MGFISIFLLGLALSCDAFAVAICKGLALGKIKFKHCLIVGLWFGFFQGFMPAIGYLLGSACENIIVSFDHYIALGLLALIGISMIREGCSKKQESVDSSLSFKKMLLLAIATSIDALAAGVTIAIDGKNIFLSVATIGVTTFFLAMLGVYLGSIFGLKYKSKAEIFGGVVLILLGIKIFLEHQFSVPFPF